eukprot:Lithocolla_globosa_v1_NODE_1683_length_2401_cov_4.531543.p2 type:complete len:166 gc:universal NODE_1683_length_2401_cov_4.531543:106-603(+)
MRLEAVLVQLQDVHIWLAITCSSLGRRNHHRGRVHEGAAAMPPARHLHLAWHIAQGVGVHVPHPLDSQRTRCPQTRADREGIHSPAPQSLLALPCRQLTARTNPSCWNHFGSHPLLLYITQPVTHPARAEDGALPQTFPISPNREVGPQNISISFHSRYTIQAIL